MRVFFNSSAFAKHYVQEEGTGTVRMWCERATEIGLAEIISAFCRLRRENRITAEQYLQLKSSLLADIEDIALYDLTPEVQCHAVESLENNTLRGMDAIHIGSTLALKADVFVSADQRQCEAARKAGLQVEVA
jgi:predicted nucleic acid-binding protein